jgi:O-antigen/teichoic acid export membrane protein
MLMSLTANMPRYFVVHALGDSALGIFSATSYLAMAASVAISAIAESKVTQLSQLLAFGSLDKATRLLKATIRITLTLSAASLLGSAVLGKWILQRAYHYEHGGAVGLLMLMMVIAGVADLASVQGYALLAARRFRSYTATLIVSAAVCAVGCFYGVAAGGLRGAAFGCLAGYGAQLVVSAWMMRSVLRPARNMAVSLRHVAITEG